MAVIAIVESISIQSPQVEETVTCLVKGIVKKCVEDQKKAAFLKCIGVTLRLAGFKW